MIDVRTQTIIHCRKIRIWEYISDPDNAPEWFAHIKAVSWQTPKPAKLGSRLAVIAQFLGRRLRFTYEIIRWEPLERVTLQTVHGLFPIRTTYSFRSLNEETTRVTIEYTGSGRKKGMFFRLLSWRIKRANRKTLAQLKALMEERYGCDPDDAPGKG